MQNDLDQEPGSSPAADPIALLRRDHDTVRRLAATYRETDSMDARVQAARQIVTLLDIHSQLEENIFYPAVNDIDAETIERFQNVHQQADDLLVGLKSIDLSSPRAADLMEELLAVTLQHIEQEETLFFPRLQRAVNVDMAGIALQMQAFEANLVHLQGQGIQPGARL